MNLIIHHEQAWKAACQKYKLYSLDTPQSWPILISFIETADGVGSWVTIVSPEMAAKFLSICTAERISKIDPETRHQVSIKTSPVTKPATPPNQTAPFAVGNKVTINGNTFLVTSIGPDPNEEGATAVKMNMEDGEKPMDTETQYSITSPVGQIEGLEELPIDPSKLDQKQKIADLGDPTEHVLDVERSV